MSEQWLFQLCVLLTVFTCEHAALTWPLVSNVTAVAGLPVMLNCNLTSTYNQSSGVLFWLNPAGIPVTNGFSAVDQRNRFYILIADPINGQYNLLIRYVRYPQDFGVWSCTQLMATQQVQLTVLAPPPAEDPEIMPSSIAVSLRNASEPGAVYTFTCVGHYAFPPVNLSWIRESGPSSSYTVLPPRVIKSRLNTMSFSVSLILTTANANSVFSCLSSYPTFQGRFGKRSAYFMIEGVDGAPVHQAVMSEAIQPPVVSVNQPVANKVIRLDANDKAFLLLTIFVITACLAVWVVMKKCGHRLHLDVRQHHPHQLPPVNAVNNNKQVAAELDTMLSPADKSPDTDEMLSVFAGGALWIDCSALAAPVDSVVQVTWSRNGVMLYYQYWRNNQIIGIPFNSTEGFMFYGRATSKAVGQVNIYPVIPNEDGVYQCDVIKGDTTNTGKHVKLTKTFTVFVLMGIPLNYGLLLCLTIALASAVVVLSMVAYHTVLCHSHHPPHSIELSSATHQQQPMQQKQQQQQELADARALFGEDGKKLNSSVLN